MKTKLFAMGLMAVVSATVAMGPAPGSVIARQNANANKRAPRAKTGSASKASNSQAAAPAATQPQDMQKPKPKRPVRKHPSETVGIPSGAGNCVAKLEQLASKEPLTLYEKGPEQIINNGLLWNDPHSKCSVGSDQAVRSKVFAVATAWQQKDADKVKRALADLKSSVPAEMPMEPKKPRRHRTAHKSGAASGAAAEPAAASSNSAKPATKGKSRKSKSANKNSGA